MMPETMIKAALDFIARVLNLLPAIAFPRSLLIKERRNSCSFFLPPPRTSDTRIGECFQCALYVLTLNEQRKNMKTANGYI